MTKTILVWDAQLGTHYPVAEKRAKMLVSKYSSRFSFPFTALLHTEKEDTIMPQLPPETKNLGNGAHTLIAFEVKTTKGTFGEQEEVTCMKEGTEDLTRVWLSHTGRKKIIQAADAGLVEMHEDGSWEVVTGARFLAMVVGGKIVGLAKAPAAKTE